MPKARMAKLVPWYHVNKDRCEVLTVRGPQCVNSASYTATTGQNGSTEKTAACKPHADMLLLDGWKVRLVRARRFTL
jgi:hypothetical protein